MVLSQLRTLIVVSDTSITVPSIPRLGISIQSPTLSILFAESCTPATRPRSVSLKINDITAAEAPKPVSRPVGAFFKSAVLRRTLHPSLPFFSWLHCSTAHFPCQAKKPRRAFLSERGHFSFPDLFSLSVCLVKSYAKYYA